VDARPAKIALLGLLASLLLLPSSASAAETARTADSFVDSIGVNTHLSYSDTAYSRFGEVKAKLAELGVRHIREGLVPERPDQYERLSELGGMGIGATLILGDPNSGPEGLAELISTVRSNLRGSVDAVEGANEFDSWGGSDWLPRLADYQQRLYAAIKGDPALASLPVLGPSIVQRRNQEALGDISGALDYGNFHPYPDGFSPEQGLDSNLVRAAYNSGAKPLVATETGYHTTAGWSGEHNAVSEQAMATYIPRLYLEYFRRGVARTFSYELLDEKSNRGEREDNFGLLRNDLSEKPAFVALRNTIDILEDRGPAFAPTAVAYSLDGDVADVHHLLLQKSDGTFYLALWRATDVWDPASQTDLQAPSGRVTLEFDRQVTGAASFLPNVSADPLATLRPSAGRLGVNVGAEATIVRLTLGQKAAPGRIHVSVSRRSVPAGGRVAVRGRLPKQAAGSSRRVEIQQLQRGWKKWRTVGYGRTTRKGVFRKSLRLSRTPAGRVSRIRVVAREVRASRAVKVRVRSDR
jgi:hypothetical protein